MKLILVFALLAALAAPGQAVTLLTFEGLRDLEPVQNFYNGGAGGLGSVGPNLGVVFNANALALIDEDAGGSGNFGGEPSPNTALFFLSGTAILNYAAGFETGFSFYYTAINQPGSINVYDGIDGTGNLLATLLLPLTAFNGAPDPTGQFSPFVPIGVTFDGIARSIDFGGTVNQIGFDNITFGSATPGGGNGEVPEPATWTMVAGGALALLLSRRKR